MTIEEMNSVQGGENTEGVSAPSSQAAETPVSPSSGVSQETPAPSPSVDVESIRAKYEQDIRNLKSTLQKRESQVTAEWRSKYDQLQKQMHETRMASMTDEERKRYEAQLQTQEYQSLQERLAELENDRQTASATYEAYEWFLEQGVPASAMKLTEGYEGVTRAGWQYMTSELQRLRQMATNPPQPAKVEPAPLKQAPGVVTDKGTPAQGTTWAALRAQGWTDEAIYRAVESGRLSPSIIPSN